MSVLFFLKEPHGEPMVHLLRRAFLTALADTVSAFHGILSLCCPSRPVVLWRATLPPTMGRSPTEFRLKFPHTRRGAKYLFLALKGTGRSRYEFSAPSTRRSDSVLRSVTRSALSVFIGALFRAKALSVAIKARTRHTAYSAICDNPVGFAPGINSALVGTKQVGCLISASTERVKFAFTMQATTKGR